MTEPLPWKIVRGNRKHEPLFREFKCALSDVLWETEVEDHIRDSLVEWAFGSAAAEVDSRILLLALRESGELLAVSAYERSDSLSDGDGIIPSVCLSLIAVSCDWQGATIGDDHRVSNVIMDATAREIAREFPNHAVWCRVHQQNGRSLSFVGRHGFTTRLASLSRPNYVALTSTTD
ncbi:hypothetical protein [Catellatospora sichuanensis]|uniref:hypothetical protein n=1 Tax=Catellatospora sichuanensis TaxID=1969805 RepID=UPI001183BC18|nr:hypothetical protein [Catellatospora sichuanensis]